MNWLKTNKTKIISASLLGLVVLFFGWSSVFAQNIGVDETGTALGLQAGPVGLSGVRLLIVNIIKVVLSFLGLVAVGVIMYGGYVWMTAGGNSDRVQTARRILINGAIGLVIILSAYAIVSFIVNQFNDIINSSGGACEVVGEERACGSCGGTQECQADGTWGSCTTSNLCIDEAAFSLVSYSPTGDDNPVNTEVKMRFKKEVEDMSSATVQDYFIVTATDQGNVETDVSGTIAYKKDADGNDDKTRLVFIPDKVCVEDSTQRCFEKNIVVNVTVSDSLKAASGERLSCPVGGCTWSFGVGEGFDKFPPTVSVIQPRQVVAQSINAPLELFAKDDYKIAAGGFKVSAGKILTSLPGFPLESIDHPPTDNQRRLTATDSWDTSGLELFSEQTVTAWVDDVAGYGPVEQKTTVTVVAPWCTNGQLNTDKGETDIDCGPVDSGCLPCGAPIITRIDPVDAGPGDYVQISGRNFGDEPGSVTFSGPSQLFGNDDDAVGITPAECVGVDTWQPNQIIIQLPNFVVDENGDNVNDTTYQFDSQVAVTNTDNVTGDTLKWRNVPLNVNTAVRRPSICGVVPDAIQQCDLGDDRLVTITGRQFGGNAAEPGNVYFADKKGTVKTWSSAVPASTSAYVPSIAAGNVAVTVENSNQKYCVGGLNNWSPCQNESECSSGVCEFAKSNQVNLSVSSCVPRPVISSITPSAGPNEQLITVVGSNFGNSPRELIFRNSDGAEVSAQFEFPAQCGATDYWKNNQIIAKVPKAGTPPAGLPTGIYDVIVRLATGDDLNESEPVKFTINNDPIKPGLYCAIPDNGPEGLAVQLVGEKLGSNAGSVAFSNNVAAGIENWSDNVVRTTVPAGAVTGQVVAKNSGGSNSNPLAFTVGSCTQNSCGEGSVCCGDGSCRLNADECPVPPTLPLSSYRWRVTTGNPAPKVVVQGQCLINLVQNWSFENTNETDNTPTNWNILPPTIVTTDDNNEGDSALELVGSAFQNIFVPTSEGETLTLQFSAKGKAGDVLTVDLSDAVDNIIFESVTLEADDVWQKFIFSGTAHNSSQLGINFIRFNETPILIDSVVVQSASSETATTQSPSPFINTKDACLNTAVALRFTTPIKSLGNVVIEDCGSDKNCENIVSQNPLTPSKLGVDGLVAVPSALKPETWYRVSVSDVVSDRDVLMTEPYVWTFRTSDGTCAIGGSSCSPNKYTLTTSQGVGSSVTASAALQALNCNILACDAGDIDWTKEGDDVVTLGTAGVCSVPISVKVPNPQEGRDIVRPEVTGDPTALVGMCKIDVKFSPLEVSGAYPKCNTACSNTAPYIAFSVPLQTLSVGGANYIKPGQYRFEECDDQACTNSTDFTTSYIWVEDKSLTPADKLGLNLPDNAAQYFIGRTTALTPFELNPNKFYRVTILSGSNGVTSVDNKELTGDNYSWVFGTRSESCGIDRVSISPDQISVKTIGSKVDYFASPFSTGDACAPGGQLLVASAFDYGWLSSDSGVATISNYDEGPVDNKVDPKQIAIAVGQSELCFAGDSSCQTLISTTELGTGKTDSGSFTLQCGFTPAGECRAFNKDLNINGNFEANVTNNNIPGWQFNGDYVNGADSQLVSGGGPAGLTYYRAPTETECASGICYAQVNIEFETSLKNESTLSLSLFAKSITANQKPQLRWLAIDANNLATALDWGELSNTNNKLLSNDWQLYSIDISVPANTKKIEFSFGSGATSIAEDNFDMDGVSIQLHSCTNDTSKTCSVSSQCNANLNVCGLGSPDGTCENIVNGVGTCSNDSLLECNTNLDCRLAVNPTGCCGLRPYVTKVDYAKYTNENDEVFMCRNAALQVDFSDLMSDGSFRDNVKLEWLDTTTDPNKNETTCVIADELALARKNIFARILDFFKDLFGITANAEGVDTWCGIGVSAVPTIVYDASNRPDFTRLLVYPNELLDSRITYRLVIEGESVNNPTGGVRSIYGVAMNDDRNGFSEGGNFIQSLANNTAAVQGGTIDEISEEICSIDRVEVDVAPLLPQDSNIVSSPADPRDLFQCVGDNCNCDDQLPGEPGCRILSSGQTVDEDQDDATEGNQHNYIAKAMTSNGFALNADFKWSKLDVQNLLNPLAVVDQDNLTVTINDDSGVSFGIAQVKVAASPKGLLVESAANTVNVIFDRCVKRWTNGPLVDEGNNLTTTYCLDKAVGQKNTETLPSFTLAKYENLNPDNNQLGIRSEYILANEVNTSEAIAFRVVENKLHLTSLQWYLEQPIERGSPKFINGGIDGYPAFQDGRTVYVGFGNAIGPNLYTNILMASYSQNAGPETIEVFNRLLQNLTFNINQLNVGQCRATQQLTCASGAEEKIGTSCTENNQCGIDENGDTGECKVSLEGRSCLIDNDCSAGFICGSEKAAVVRDVDRFTKLLDIQKLLADYRYGDDCPRVTVGAPGDADCNGVINGQDIIRASEMVGSSPRSYCVGADYDLSGGNITQNDVGAIRDYVARNCKRPASRATNYPALNSGTFVQNMTTSVWPSWQQTLAQDLGEDLPLDPINLFSQCGVNNLSASQIKDLPHSPYTCWDPASKTYASFNAVVSNGKITSNSQKLPDVPRGESTLGTHVLTYTSDNTGTGYSLCTYFEGNALPSPVASGQYTEQGKNRVCVTTQAASSLPSMWSQGSLGDSDNLSPVPTQSVIKLTMYGGAAGEVKMQGGNAANSVNCTKSALNESVCTLYVPLGVSVTLNPSGSSVSFSWDNCPNGTTQCTFVASKTGYDLRIKLSKGANLFLQDYSDSGSWVPENDPQFVFTKNGSAVNCLSNSTCAVAYGDKISIAPVLGSDTLFDRWAGSNCEGQGQTCEFVVDEATEGIGFYYKERKSILLVEVISTAGKFGGSVTSNPTGITLTDCDQQLPSAACRDIALYSKTQSVTLTAVPSQGKKTVWDGCDNGVTTGNICNVVMSNDKTVRARFIDTSIGLTVSKKKGAALTSVGSVATISKDPAYVDDINCPESTCSNVSKDYVVGTKITLMATAPAAGTFVGWDGCPSISTTNALICNVTINGAVSVTAKFSVPSAFIKITKNPATGGTTVVSPVISGNGICAYDSGSSTCTIEVPANTNINVKSSANVGYNFVNLSGGDFTSCSSGSFVDCGISSIASSYINTSPFDINVNYNVSNKNLRVNVTDNDNSGGTGSVTLTDKSPCSGSCDYEYPTNTEVTLTANPTNHSTFVGWDGCVAEAGLANVCKVTMSQAKTVTAKFEKEKVAVNFDIIGPQSGVVKIYKIIRDGSGNIVSDNTNPDWLANSTSNNQPLAVPYGTELKFETMTAANIVQTSWGASGTLCNGTSLGSACGPKTITSNVTLSVSFEGQYQLSLQKFGAGVGAVKVRDATVAATGPFLAEWTFGSAEEVKSVAINASTSIVISASYNGWITTFMCPGSGSQQPAEDTTVCPVYTMTGDATSQIRFNTAPVFEDVGSLSSPIEAEESKPSQIRTETLLVSAQDADLVSDNFSLNYTQPVHGTVSCTAATKAVAIVASTCTYTPSDYYSGPDSFTYQFTDGYYTPVSKTVYINVVNIPDAPSATANGPSNAQDGDTVSLSCTVSDLDLPSDSHTYEWTIVDSLAGTVLSSITSSNTSVTFPSRNPSPVTFAKSDYIACSVGGTPQCKSATGALGASQTTSKVTYNYTNPNGASLVVFVHRRGASSGTTGPELTWNGLPPTGRQDIPSTTTAQPSTSVYYWKNAASGSHSLIVDSQINNVSANWLGVSILSYSNVGEIELHSGWQVQRSGDNIAITTDRTTPSESIVLGSVARRNASGSTPIITAAGDQTKVSGPASEFATGSGTSDIVVATGQIDSLVGNNFKFDSSDNSSNYWSGIALELRRVNLDTYTAEIQCKVTDSTALSDTDSVYINVSP